MIRFLRRAAALLLSAAVLAASGAPALAQQEVRVAPVEAPTTSATSGASALSAPALGASLPAAIDGPIASLTPSPWNPSGPTVLIAAPVAKLAPAVGAASMPPVAPAIDAASTPPPAPAVGAASMPPVGDAAPKIAADAPAATVPSAAGSTAPKKARAKTGDAALSGSKAGRLAKKIAAELNADFHPENGELPPPADAIDSLAQATLKLDPSRAYHASPEDWRDEILYPIVVDRFNKGEGSKPFGDPRDGTTRHGGNIRGVIDKLDYIKGSRATTIIVSPLTMSIPEAYHGYAPVHFLAVDPHFGTMADFKELVAKAHEKGLRVVLDWVINHSGPVFEYSDGETQWTGDGKPGPVEWTRPLKPVEFTEDDFSRKRVITNWDDASQSTQGDFPPNYRHFATDRPETQRKLIHIAQWWMKETDIDGLRLDAVRHVAPGFLPVFSAAIRGYAAALGKSNFLLLGESSTGMDSELKPFLENGSLDTLYNYPEYRRANGAVHGAAPTRDLENSLAASQSVLGDAAANLVRFVDLHDVYRFLLADTPGDLLKPALSYAMLSLGVPLVSAGTEQAFRQLHGRLEPEGGDMPADPQNREDMFASGQYKSESSAGDKFDETAPGYKYMRALADLRAKYPALRRGKQYPRWSDAGGPGLYAFSRILGDQEVLVVMNTAGEARDAQMFVDGGINPAGSTLDDALNPGYEVAARAAGGGSVVGVAVPAYGVRVLVRPAPAQ